MNFGILALVIVAAFAAWHFNLIPNVKGKKE